MRRRTTGTALKATPLFAPLAALVALALTALALAGCNPNPVVVQRKPAATAVTPAESETPPVTGTTIKNGDGTFTLEFPLPGSAEGTSGRSLVNYEDVGELQSDADYYQMVLVDDTHTDTVDERGKIWASASASRNREDPTNNGVLRALVKENTTYHILFLHGKKAGSADPILLGSGYLRYHVGTTSDSVTIRMVPVLIDATVKAGSAKWAAIKNIAWVKAGNFDVTVSLFSRDASQDGKTAPHGNPLWPLRLAEARNNTAVWDQFTSDMPSGINRNSPQYGATVADGNWTGNYWEYDGEENVATHASLTNMSAPLKMASAKLEAKAAGYYSEGANTEVGASAKSTSTGLDTSGNTITGNTFTFSAFSSL
ncbi:MAG: hypothetical protein LBS86_04590, partial [Treponema sp.]|nr:hypothetical protein [Treponema sp.]